MADDIDGLIKWAEANGWDVPTDANGYRRFHDPDGNYIVKYPKTPSNPRRRLLEVKTALKRNGLEIPPPSKSELRRRARKESQ